MKANQKINFNLNLSSSTPLKALEAKALKASAIAVASKNGKQSSKKDKSLQKKDKKKGKKLSPIEASLLTIKKAAENWKLDGKYVEFEKQGRFSSSSLIINIFPRPDTPDKPTRDDESFVQASPMEEEGDKKKKAPMRKFVFYPDPLDSNRLGSVAIYGDDIPDLYESISKSTHLFGIKIKKCALDCGLRPFVDVKFSKF